MTFSIMTLSIKGLFVTLSINTLFHYTECHCAESPFLFSVMLNVIILSNGRALLCSGPFMLSVINKPFMLSVIMLSVIMLSAIMLSVIMLSVVMLSVIMLSVLVPQPLLELKIVLSC
jgi:hypothetical protein